MCFSATASFTAASVLVAVGIVSVARTRTRARIPLAAIPLLFAAQQLTEALVWRAHSRVDSWRIDEGVVDLYLFFALALWPAFVPFAATCLEPDRARRRVLTGLTLAGTVLGGWLFAHAARANAYACVVDAHLYYSVRLRFPMRVATSALYVAVTVGPLLLSRERPVRALGVAFAVAYGISAVLYRIELVSVWCFFAAWLSVAIAWIVGHPTDSNSPILRARECHTERTWGATPP